MKKDLVSGVVWVCIFGAIFFMARTLPESVAPYPTLIASAGFILALFQFGIFSLRYYKAKKQIAAGTLELEPVKKASPEQVKRSVLAVGFLAGYGLCFSLLGYLLSTPLFLFGFMHILAPAQEDGAKATSKKTLLTELVIAVILTAVIYVLFQFLLNVRFPTGIFMN